MTETDFSYFLILGNVCFVLLRDQHYTCQATLAKVFLSPHSSLSVLTSPMQSDDIPKCFVTFVSKITKESLVDVTAVVVKPESESGTVTGGVCMCVCV